MNVPVRATSGIGTPADYPYSSEKMATANSDLNLDDKYHHK